MKKNDNGYNPMLWNCDERGCYNLKQRPKLEVFAECFGGRVNFGDVDAGLVERNFRVLLLEWKSAPIEIPAGQDIMYRNLSKTGLMVVLTVAGNAETMHVTHTAWYAGGIFSGWAPGNLEHAKEICRRWDGRARSLGPVKVRRALPAEKLTKVEMEEWVADYEAHEHDFDSFAARR